MPRPKHVLVVDDEDAIRAVVSEVLADEGYDVQTARNGREAVDLVRDWRPDLIVLDLMMPIMDGRRFLEACRRQCLCRDVPIILMSAGRRASELSGLSVQAFIAKPFDLDDLLATVQHVGH